MLRWIEEFNLEQEVDRGGEGGRGSSEEEPRPQRRYIARGCKQIQGENLIVGSLDVKSLYPSCKAKQTGEYIVEFFKQTDLSFNGVNLNAIVRYLALTGFKGEGGLNDYIPKPKGTTTLNSWLKTESPNQFREPIKEICLAETQVINQLLGHVVAKATEVVIKNHYYTLGGGNLQTGRWISNGGRSFCRG